MPREVSGHLVVNGQRFGLAVSRVNEFITSRLLASAIDALIRHGCDENNITIVHVPGAFELPVIVKRMALSGNFDGIVALGCVIRGDTPHFEYIVGATASGLSQVALETGVATTFGIITADTLEQAINRAGVKNGNKGADAAIAAIEMVNLLRLIPGRK